jgi:hypothetical protein
MKKVKKSPKTLGERIKWLFTKNGLPVLISLIIGIVLGYLFNGALALILGTIAGFIVLKLFNKLPIRLTPWQALVTDIAPTIGKICFFMIFLLPVANDLMLPDNIHNPNTLTKYVSIIIALPKNLFTKPTLNYFPGFAFIVLISIVLMFWGSLNLGKIKGLILAFLGLLLYTFSPTITSVINGDIRIRILMSFFNIGYYLAWLGLIIVLVSRFLTRILKVNPGPLQGKTSMLGFLPPLIGLGFLSHLHTIGITGSSSTFGSFDFETLHHTLASGFNGATAGLGSGSIIDDEIEGDDGTGTENGDTSEPDSDETSPPEAPPVEPPPTPTGPQPSTDPENPPGTTIEHNSDGTITKTHPDGTVGTKHTDGTVYVKAPDGSTGVYYPDGTSKEWSPDGGLEVKQPNGDIEKINADGVKSSVINNPDGSIDINSGYGGTLHCPKEGNPVGSITTYDGYAITANGDGSGSISTDMGKVNIDQNGNMDGTLSDKQGNSLTMKNDGSWSAQTTDGDTVAVDSEGGINANFKNGSFIKMDGDGKNISAHIKDDNGVTIDAHTDENGGAHVKDDQGNSADVNTDGSGTMTQDGITTTQDAHGNASITDDKGTTWTANSNGTGKIFDKQGNSIDLHKDGSITVKTADGKTTNYTQDELKQMQAQPDTGAPGAATGGN